MQPMVEVNSPHGVVVHIKLAVLGHRWKLVMHELNELFFDRLNILLESLARHNVRDRRLKTVM